MLKDLPWLRILYRRFRRQQKVSLLSCCMLLLFYIFLPENVNPRLSYPKPRSIFSLASNGSPKLVIKLIAFDRLESLNITLESLKAADYEREKVDLDIYLDHPTSPDKLNSTAIDTGADPMHGAYNQSSDFFSTEDSPTKISKTHHILQFLSAFEWPHGQYKIHHRSSNAGVQMQWLEAWYPVDKDEFAYFVEDDVVVSKQWYKIIKEYIRKYYYDYSSEDRNNIIGISTQRLSYTLGRVGKNPQNIHFMTVSPTRSFALRNKVLLYQSVGTWGQLLFPNQWHRFITWFDKARHNADSPYIYGLDDSILRSSDWYLQFGERIWTPYMIKFMLSESLFSIYLDLFESPTENGRNNDSIRYLTNRCALSTSRREVGMTYSQALGPDTRLLENIPSDFYSSSSEYFPSLALIPLVSPCGNRYSLPWILHIPFPLQINPKRIALEFIEMSSTSRITAIIHGVYQQKDIPKLINCICHMRNRAQLFRFIVIVSSHDRDLIDRVKKVAGGGGGGIVILGSLHTSNPQAKNKDEKKFGHGLKVFELESDFMINQDSTSDETQYMSEDKIRQSQHETKIVIDELVSAALEFGNHIYISHISSVPMTNVMERVLLQDYLNQTQAGVAQIYFPESVIDAYHFSIIRNLKSVAGNHIGKVDISYHAWQNAKSQNMYALSFIRSNEYTSASTLFEAFQIIIIPECQFKGHHHNCPADFQPLAYINFNSDSMNAIKDPLERMKQAGAYDLNEKYEMCGMVRCWYERDDQILEYYMSKASHENIE